MKQGTQTEWCSELCQPDAQLKTQQRDSFKFLGQLDEPSPQSSSLFYCTRQGVWYVLVFLNDVKLGNVPTSYIHQLFHIHPNGIQIPNIKINTSYYLLPEFNNNSVGVKRMISPWFKMLSKF